MTQPFDYSDSVPFDMELIPAGEIPVVRMRIREGGGGEDGVLKRSKDGKSEFLDVEFTLLDGKHTRMKFWQNLLLTGETDGHQQMIARNRAILKAALDSAYNLHPDDKSPEARAKRVKLLRDFDGLTFQVRIGVEKGGKRPDGTMYRDKNVIDDVITPNKPGYRGPFEQGPSSGPTTPPASTPTTPVAKPVWAQ
jgi:hypothetical protein